MTHGSHSHQDKDNAKLLMYGLIVLLVLLGIWFFMHRKPPVVVKEVKAFEKNELYCDNIPVGSDLNFVINMTKSMGMQKLDVKNPKGDLVHEYVKDAMPANDAVIKIKSGMLIAYAAAHNEHRYCELKFDKKKVTEKIVANQNTAPQ